MKNGPDQCGPSSKDLYEERQLQGIARRWDAKAADWDRALEDPRCHLNEDDAYQRFLAELGLIVEQRRQFCARHGVIDSGCATGLVLARVISSFAWGLGVDISPGMIQAAEAKHIANARFIVGDCFNLAEVSPKAGAVVSRGVLLSHYGHQQGRALLQSARAALVEQGFLVCDFLNHVARAAYQHAPRNKTYFTPAEVCDIALDAGFRSPRVIGGNDRRVQLLVAE